MKIPSVEMLISVLSYAPSILSPLHDFVRFLEKLTILKVTSKSKEGVLKNESEK